MKGIIAIIVFFLFGTYAYAQSGPTATVTAPAESATGLAQQTSALKLPSDDSYKNTPEWSKYKTLRAVGWTSLGLGLTNTFTGLVVAAFQAAFHDSIDAGLPVIITSGVVTLASIPVLIRAYQFRSKARKLALSIGVTRLHSPNDPTSVAKPTTAPALSLALTF